MAHAEPSPETMRWVWGWGWDKKLVEISFSADSAAFVLILFGFMLLWALCRIQPMSFGLMSHSGIRHSC